MNEDCPGCVTGEAPAESIGPNGEPDSYPSRSNGAPDGVRAADESRLPPPGSFRSGLYRLLRALFINQGPNPKNTGAHPEAPVERESAKQPASGAAPSAPEPDGTRQTGTRAGRGAHRGRRSGASITKSMHWLAQAVLAGQLLPPRTANPATLPVPSQTRPGRHWRPGIPHFPELPELPESVQEIRNRTATLLSRTRGAISQGEEPPVPRSLEVALVATLTVAAVVLRTWNLSGAPVGVHGDETALAMEALRSISGESIGIWTGVTLGHPAGYAHWMALIFRLGEADVAAMRLASAIPGAAIIPVGYLLVRSLYSFRVAIVSAALVTFSFWFVIQSRIAFGGITSVFMALLAMWLIVWAVQSRRVWVGGLAGLALGLSLYAFMTSLLYYTGVWCVVLAAMAVNRDLRRRREVWACLAVSVVVGSPMLLFYATSGFIGPNLNDLYGVTLSSPSTWLRLPGLAVEAALLVNRPVQGNTVDAAPAIPLLTVAGSVFFWAGLAAALLFVKERRNQLLIAAWLVGMAPILLVPGAESRRYLLGIFFVLTLVSIGLNAVLAPTAARLYAYLKGRGISAVHAKRLGIGAASAAASVLIVLFAAQNVREFDRWGNGESVKWFFNYEYHQSLLYLKDLPPGIPVIFYTVRQPFDGSIRRFELPGARGADGAEAYGGTGSIPPPGSVTEDTVFILLDEYLPLAAEIRAIHPGAVPLREEIRDGRTIFVAYLVPGNGQSPGGSQAPLPQRPR